MPHSIFHLIKEEYKNICIDSGKWKILWKNKSFMTFCEHKFSRINSLQIFKDKNFWEQIKIWRNLRKFVLAEVCTFKVADFYWHLLLSSTNSISPGVDFQIQVSLSWRKTLKIYQRVIYSCHCSILRHFLIMYLLFWGYTRPEKPGRHFSMFKKMQAWYLI